MKKIRMKPKKSFLTELSERKKCISVKNHIEPVDLLFPLVCNYSLKQSDNE